MSTALEPLVWVRSLEPQDRRRIRERARLSRQELAEALEASPVSIWRWETDRRRPSGKVGRRYCRLLHELALTPTMATPAFETGAKGVAETNDADSIG